MLRRFLPSCITVLVAMASAAHAAPYRAPRLADGAPDLQGDWSNLTITPLERPKVFKGLVATDSEAATFLANRKARIEGKKPTPQPGAASSAESDPDPLGQATSEYPDRDVGLTRIDGRRRSSILVEPGDGKLPYSAAGKALATEAEARDDHDFSGPEVRISDERCIDATASAVGPPMLGEAQNANYKIVQTPGEILILSEMIHDARIVHMGARHPAFAAHPHMGDSIGWWQGNTLVIETVDQSATSAARFVGDGVFYVSQSAKVTERLTRISPSKILYRFTIEDPTVFAQPLRGESIFTTSNVPMYEYACHEGNYALTNILAGARADERKATLPPGAAGDNK